MNNSEIPKGYGFPLTIMEQENRPHTNHLDPNEATENRLSKKEVVEFAESAHWSMFEHEVRTSKAYVNGIREGVPMFETKRVRDYISDEFFQVGEEFLWKVGLK